MIDFDALEEQARNTCLKECKYLSTASLIELITRLHQAEKDAARYRWLRDECKYVDWRTIGASDSQDWDDVVDECAESMKCN